MCASERHRGQSASISRPCLEAKLQHLRGIVSCAAYEPTATFHFAGNGPSASAARRLGFKSGRKNGVILNLSYNADLFAPLISFQPVACLDCVWQTVNAAGCRLHVPTSRAIGRGQEHWVVPVARHSTVLRRKDQRYLRSNISSTGSSNSQLTVDNRRMGS